MSTRTRIGTLRPLGVLAALGLGAAVLADPPQYTIYNLGLLEQTDSGSQANRVSNNGLVTGRSLRSGASQAFSWSQGAGLVGLPNLSSPSRPFGIGTGINDNGVVVGTGYTTSFFSGALPLIWQNGVLTQLPLPTGETVGRANDVNSSNVAVGSVGGGSLEAGVIYAGGAATRITATTGNGSFMRTANAINDGGWVAGNGIDPNNAAVNVGMVYDMTTGTAFSIGALSGLNGALAFDVSNAGHVVGSSMLNQGSGTPFRWTQAGGMVAIGLPTGTSSGIARGVNSNGWVVGTASSAFAIPFLYDGTSTYRVADLIVNGAGWDLLTNTSSSAMSISENGIVVGTGVFDGRVHAYAMVPVPEPASLAALAIGLVAAVRRRRSVRQA
jgi:uncharacterized membrane protein